ncbi:hypothetical protein [Nostoc sp. MG11]|uniref:hypothetical protein n=1 Tax=Nostoc sp. MG11 TaxID=2721166 RepID=UPI001868988E|nr:hypothetical protein [Nostoc sp. MG11]
MVTSPLVDFPLQTHIGLTPTLLILLYVRAACRRQTLRVGGADAPEGVLAVCLRHAMRTINQAFWQFLRKS